MTSTKKSGCGGDIQPSPNEPEVDGPENKDAASDSGLRSAGIVKSTAPGSLAELILAALKDGPASGRVLAQVLGRRRPDVMACAQELRKHGAIVRAGKAWRLAPAGRCQGRNVAGGRCGREAALGSRFCSLHQEPEAEPNAGPQPFLPDGSIEQNNVVAWRYFTWANGYGFQRTDAGRQVERAYRIRAFKWLRAHDPRMKGMLARDRKLAAAIETQLEQEPEAKLSIDKVNAIEFFDMLMPIFDGGETDESDAAGTIDAEPAGIAKTTAPGSLDDRDEDAELDEDAYTIEIDKPGEDPDDESETIL